MVKRRKQVMTVVFARDLRELYLQLEGKALSRERVSNMRCSICERTFRTKEELIEHIYDDIYNLKEQVKDLEESDFQEKSE